MSGARETQSSPFWTFSLRLYGRPGAPAACLELQDRAGADVNVLLFCLFAAASGRRVSQADAIQAMARVAEWKGEVVAPLRAARRFLKRPPAPFVGGAVEDLRTRVKAIELEAERIQQEALYEAFPMTAFGAPAADAARDNIDACALALGATFDAAAVDALVAAYDGVRETLT